MEDNNLVYGTIHLKCKKSWTDALSVRFFLLLLPMKHKTTKLIKMKQRHLMILIALLLAGMAATQELVRHFFPEIDVAIGEHEAAGIRKKPAPDTVYEALRQLAVSPKLTAVYVGDSDVDIATARNSGLPCISVLWGVRDRDFLLSHGAITLAGHPMDILD